MTVYTLLALLIFLLFGPLSAALLLWQRLGQRRYIAVRPRDVAGGEDERPS